jgi:hypothetical protein
LDFLPRHSRDAGEMIAIGTLNLPPRILLGILQMPVAVRAIEFEFAHEFCFPLFWEKFS